MPDIAECNCAAATTTANSLIAFAAAAAATDNCRNRRRSQSRSRVQTEPAMAMAMSMSRIRSGLQCLFMSRFAASLLRLLRLCLKCKFSQQFPIAKRQQQQQQQHLKDILNVRRTQNAKQVEPSRKRVSNAIERKKERNAKRGGVQAEP